MGPSDSQREALAGTDISIDLWQWSLDAGIGCVRRLLCMLTDDERERARRIIYEHDRIAFIVGRARLRQVLSNYTDLAPKAVTFSYDPHGKPSATNVPVSFNISHSGLVAVAVVARAQGLTLGIDVERMRNVEHGLAERFFSATENQHLADLKGKEWLIGFFRCWTRKEAVVKALGDGLSIELSRFDVTVLPDQPPRVTSFDGDSSAGDEWSLLEFVPSDDYIGAIAVRAGGRPITIVDRGDPICLDDEHEKHTTRD